ncbi:MAG: tRNA uridine-5-carboxymethylaminomethyl(34) synthesis GTPase MnmE [Spirochaetia bacterium]
MSAAYSLGDPIVALATPYAQSALSLLRISGDGVCEIIKAYFSRPQGLVHSHVACCGVFCDLEGQEIDEVMMTTFHAPKSFTGEDVVEICSHGNMRIVAKIFQVLLSAGIRMALPGEFSYRATLLGKMDLVKAEAIHELITAKSELAIKHAFTHLRGHLSLELRKVYSQIENVGAYLRMHLDYPEDEVEPLPEFSLNDSTQILQGLLLNSRNLELWKNGATVVIVGAPNVGKSSLFNLFLEQDRAIVSPIAGTTRDYLEADIELQGVPIRLIDTAGLHETTDGIEQCGIEKSMQLMLNADLILHVIDIGGIGYEPDLQPYQEKVLPVVNKIDLGGSHTYEIAISVTKKQGINTLITEIIQRLDFTQIHDHHQQLMLGSVRQKDLCQKALAQIQAFTHAQQTADLDTMYFHITQGMQALGEILGTHIQQDLITRMFSQFCLGK